MIISEKIPSKPEVLPQFASKVIDKIKIYFRDEDIVNVRLSLEEALVNAMKHGNKMNPDLPVEVYVEVEDKKLVIKVRDQGEGFDFNKLPNPTLDENIKKTSGRGIFLIKNLMDRVEFFDCGRGIKMVKFLNKEEQK